MVEEALLDMSEMQSPTLMIQGVLGERAPKEEATEMAGAIKEEAQVRHLGWRIMRWLLL